MIFNTPERILLYSVLPKQENVANLRIIRELQQELSFSEEEKTAISLVVEPNGLVRWDTKSDIAKDIPLGDGAVKIICDSLAELDRKKQLGIEFLDVYDRLMQEKASRENKKS